MYVYVHVYWPRRLAHHSSHITLVQIDHCLLMINHGAVELWGTLTLSTRVVHKSANKDTSPRTRLCCCTHIMKCFDEVATFAIRNTVKYVRIGTYDEAHRQCVVLEGVLTQLSLSRSTMTTSPVYSSTTASNPKASWFLVPSEQLDKTRFGIKLCEVVSSETRGSVWCCQKYEWTSTHVATNSTEPERFT